MCFEEGIRLVLLLSTCVLLVCGFPSTGSLFKKSILSLILMHKDLAFIDCLQDI